MCFTVAFSDMQFRHGSDVIVEGQTFKSQAQLRTLSFAFVFFFCSVFSHIPRIPVLSRNNPPLPKATFKNKQSENVKQAIKRFLLSQPYMQVHVILT